MIIQAVNCYLGSAAPVAYTTLDSRDKTANFALSGGDLTATRSGGSAVGYVLGRDGKATGNWKFEVTIGAISSGCRIGIIGAGAAPNTFLGYYESNGYGHDGNVWKNNNLRYAGSTFTTGDVITVMTDGTNVWFAKNGVVITGSGDPEAHTTGGLIGVLGPSLKAYYPAISSEAGSVQFTVNFGATAWAYPLLAPSYAGWSTTTPPASLSTFRSARIAIRSAGNFAHAFAEWEMMTSSGGANILTGGTPTASHSLAGGAGALTSGFDGNTTTWTGVSTPSGATANQASAYFQYAFGSNAARNVTHLAIRGRDGGGGGQTQAPTAFDLYLSDDNAVFHKNNVGLSFGTFSGTTPGHRQELAL